MPRVLFITADQWRADCLGVAGHACVRTPHLDALASDGIRFTRHYAQAVPCGPSRASLHTGMYLMNHRVVRNGTPLDRRFSNIALELRKLGMEPALVGYTDSAPDPRGREPGDPALHTYTGVLPGFRQLVPGSEGPMAWTQNLQRLGYDVEPTRHPEDEPAVWDHDLDHPEAARRGGTYAPAPYAAEHSDTAFSTDAAIAYIQQRAGTDWFLHLSLLRPHPPFIVPPPYHDLFTPEQGPAFLGHADADGEAAAHPYDRLRRTQTERWVAAHRLDMRSERQRRQLRATYWGMIAEVDAHLGRLFAALRESGDDGDTLVVFTSDHGEQLFDHWQLGKQGYQEQSFHIPLILRAPECPPERRGARVDAFTENVDVMPTILDWLGATPPRQCDGRSLLPWLEPAPPPSWRQAAFYELDFRDVRRGRAEAELGIDMEACSFAVLRGEHYKYVQFAGLAPLLFRIDEDPHERRDLVRDPAHAAAAFEQAQRMLGHRMRHAERTWTHSLVTRDGYVQRGVAGTASAATIAPWQESMS
jgi:arylsulfatase A-like enzyme